MSRNPSRYRDPGVEGEWQPDSRKKVLRNLQNIRLKTLMDRAEADALEEAEDRYFDIITDETVFTAELICQMHRDWLSGIYEWAGHYRTVEMQKGKFRWPPAFRVPQNMAWLEDERLRDLTPCKPAPLAVVAEQVASVHAELLLVHPFREGNGRLARWLADLMFLQAGYPMPRYNFSGRGSVKRKQAYLDAVVAGYGQDYAPLTGFFRDCAEARLRELEE